MSTCQRRGDDRCLDPRADDDDQSRYRHHADTRAHPRRRGHDRHGPWITSPMAASSWASALRARKSSRAGLLLGFCGRSRVEVPLTARPNARPEGSQNESRCTKAFASATLRSVKTSRRSILLPGVVRHHEPFDNRDVGWRLLQKE